jgi:hypothetical protein
VILDPFATSVMAVQAGGTPALPAAATTNYQTCTAMTQTEFWKSAFPNFFDLNPLILLTAAKEMLEKAWKKFGEAEKRDCKSLISMRRQKSRLAGLVPFSRHPSFSQIRTSASRLAFAA